MMDKLVIPIVGETYTFFAEGKINTTHQYQATVIKLVPGWRASLSARFTWLYQHITCHWMYDKYSPYFVYCNIPEYSKKPMRFVQSVFNDWVTIDCEPDTMPGRLDVDNSYTTVYNRFNRK